MADLLAAEPLRPPRAGKGRAVLLHSQVPWHSVWQRPQEMAMGLAKHRAVVYLAPVQIHEAMTRLGGRWKPVERLANGRLLVLSPPIFSGEYKLALARRLNERLVLRLLRGVVTRGEFIYLTNAVFTSALAERLRAKFVAVDLIDDFPAFDWAPAGARAAERRLLKSASLIFAGTGAMKRRAERRFPGVEYLPSGTDIERMTTPAAEPPDLRELPHPRVLYIGTLNDRMNPQLFMEAAAANPKGSVVLVGPVHGSFALPGAQPKNMHMLGLKPHTELPGYYQHCDLGIMPFASTPAARAINPVKALEFLAVGMPVLSSPIPDVVAEFTPQIRVEEPENWPAALREMIGAPRSAEESAARQALVRERTWSRLVEQVEGRLCALESMGTRR